MQWICDKPITRNIKPAMEAWGKTVLAHCWACWCQPATSNGSCKWTNIAGTLQGMLVPTSNIKRYMLVDKHCWYSSGHVSANRQHQTDPVCGQTLLAQYRSWCCLTLRWQLIASYLLKITEYLVYVFKQMHNPSFSWISNNTLFVTNK